MAEQMSIVGKYKYRGFDDLYRSTANEMPYPSTGTLPDIASPEYTEMPHNAVAAIIPTDKYTVRSVMDQFQHSKN